MLIYQQVKWNVAKLEKSARYTNTCLMSAPQAFAYFFNVLLFDGKEKELTNIRHNSNRLIIVCRQTIEWTKSISAVYFNNLRLFVLFRVNIYSELFVGCRLRVTHALNTRLGDTFELVSYDHLTSAQEKISNQTEGYS